MVVRQPSKLTTRVRFPSPAHFCLVGARRFVVYYKYEHTYNSFFDSSFLVF